MPPARSFALLYAAQFAGFGAMMPFLPAILADGGLSATQVGAVMAAGSTMRLLAGPALGGVADRAGDARRVLAACALLAACAALGFGLAAGLALLLAVQLLHAAAAAPVMPLTDALALRGGFAYAPVRAIGSLAFIGGAVGAGVLAGWWGPRVAAWALAAGMLATALTALRLPAGPVRARAARGPLLAPFRERAFRRMLPVSALIQGSHAVYYGFSTLHWTAAGLSTAQVGLLWGLGVLAEVVLFWRGAPLMAALGVRGLALLAAGAGVLRWALTAGTTEFWPLAALNLLHGITFGAMHLAAMRALLALPPELAGRAQTLHAAAVGAATGVLTLAGGALYAGFGGGAFWAMALLCVVALPLALRLGSPP